MINAIINGIFNLVMYIFSSITSVLFGVIFALFPSLSDYFTYITQFITQALTYVSACSSLLLITNSMFVAIFDYFIIKYTIYLAIMAYKLFINVYNKFKV